MSDPIYARARPVEDLGTCRCYHCMDIPGDGEVQGFFDLRERLDGIWLPDVRDGTAQRGRRGDRTRRVPAAGVVDPRPR